MVLTDQQMRPQFYGNAAAAPAAALSQPNSATQVSQNVTIPFSMCFAAMSEAQWKLNKKTAQDEQAAMKRAKDAANKKDVDGSGGDSQMDVDEDELDAILESCRMFANHLKAQ